MITTYFFEGVKGKGFLGIFKKLAVCFDLVQKSLHLFSKSEKTVLVDSISTQLDENSSVPTRKFPVLLLFSFPA